MSKSSKPTPIALPNDLVDQIKAVCDLTGESQQTVMRLAMRIGLADLGAIKHDAAKVIQAAAKDKGQSFVDWAAQKQSGGDKPTPEKPFVVTKIIGPEILQPTTAEKKASVVNEAPPELESNRLRRRLDAAAKRGTSTR